MSSVVSASDPLQLGVTGVTTMEDYVAAYLLREGLFLTALELHAELTEEGRPVPALHAFFKDTANFPESNTFIPPEQGTT